MSRALPVCLAIAALIAAGPSGASGDPGCCVPEVRVYAPPSITLVGSKAGVPAVVGRFEVRVTDVANNPLVNAAVIVDLSRCTDLHLCADQHDPAIIVDCAARTAMTHSNSYGIATFIVLGGSHAYSGGEPKTIGAQGRIYVPPYPQYAASVTVSAYDLDGFVGVGANDFSAWLTDFGSGTSWARSDYDGSGWVGGNDLSFWLSVFADGSILESCASSCP